MAKIIWTKRSLIDLDPEVDKKSDYVVFEGTPEDLVKCKESYTGKYLSDKLKVIGSRMGETVIARNEAIY